MQFGFSIKWAGQGSRNVRFHRLHAGKYYTVLKAMTGAGYGAPSSWAELQTTRAVNCHTGTVKDVKSSESRLLSVVGCWWVWGVGGDRRAPCRGSSSEKVKHHSQKKWRLNHFVVGFFFQHDAYSMCTHCPLRESPCMSSACVIKRKI